MAKLKVFYNSACPVCDAGIAAQRKRMQAGGDCPVEWVDVHRQPQTVGELNQALEPVRERLHLRDEQGQVLVGVDAFAALFGHTRGQRWLARLLRLPGLHWLAQRAYNLFARALYRWNRWRRHW